MRCSKRYFLAAAIALAACGKSADQVPPAPIGIVPAVAHTMQPSRIEIHGEHFDLFGERHLARGTDLDASFHATLGGVALENVRWIDNHTLEATVPAGLAGDPLDLVLDGPTGQAVLPGAFRASATPPASLAIAVVAPAQTETSLGFDVSVTVSNTGSTTANHVQPSLSGPGISIAPLSPDLTLEPGQSATVTYAATASARGAATLTAAAAGTDAFDGTAVSATSTAALRALAPAALRATPHSLPATVTVGRQFDVVVEVTNDGDVDADAVGIVDPTITGPGGVNDVAAPAGAQPIPAGQTRIFTWTYLATVPGGVTISCSGTGSDILTGAPLAVSAAWPSILVQTPANLTSTLNAPTALSVADSYRLQLDVANSGDATAVNVLPSLQITGAGISVLTTPGPKDIPGHEGRSFFWDLSAVSAGNATLSVQANGVDASTAAVVSTVPVAPSVAVQMPAKLTATTTAPARVDKGQTFQVAIDVSNVGDAGAGTVSPSGSCTPATILSQSAAPAPTPLGGRTTQNFAWTFVASATGQVDCTFSASGADANDGDPVSVSQAVSILVQRPAVLAISPFTVPAAVDRGQTFNATVVVTNTGEAMARAVLPSPNPPQVTATIGTASATASPQAAKDIPGGGSATFTYAFTENGTGAGALVLHADASGTDVNSGSVVSTAAVDSSSIAVQTPAALTATVSAPVAMSVGGQTTLTFNVTNTGDTTAKGVTLSSTATGSGISLGAATGPQDVAGHTTLPFLLPLSAVSTGSVTLSLQASGSDANTGAVVATTPSSQASILVQLPARLAATATAPAQVSTGQSFQISLDVSDLGEATAANVSATASCTPATNLSQTADPAATAIVAGQPQPFAWTFVASATGQLDCTFSASGADANDGRPVSVSQPVSILVQRPAVLAISPFTVPAAVDRGQTFNATVVVTNTGEAMARAVLPSPNPPQVTATIGTASATASPQAAKDIPGGGSATFTYAFTENGTGTGALVLHADASGTDVNSGSVVSTAAVDSSSIAVQTPAALSSTILFVSALSVGDQRQLQVDVTNNGDALASAVTPSLAIAGGGLSVLSSDTPKDIPGHQTRSFFWQLSAVSPATGTLSVQADGVEANTGAAVSTAASQTVSVQAPAQLVVASATAPAGVNIGQSVQVSLVVSNPGGASAGTVSATASCNSAAVSQTAPATAALIDGGQSQTFNWTFVGSQSGPVDCVLTASGADVNDGRPVSDARTVSMVVERPAALQVSSLKVPAVVSRGQSFTATLVVANTGDAPARAVVASPDPPQVTATAGTASAKANPSAKAQEIPGGATATFSFVFVENGTGTGTLVLHAGASGTDGNDSSVVVSAPTFDSSNISVQAPAQLTSTVTVASSVSKGDQPTLQLDVTNSGDADALAVAPSLDLIGTAISVVSSPPTQPVPGHSKVPFVWTLSAVSPGTENFVVQARGVDANSGAAVATAPSVQPAITVQTPAQLAAKWSPPAVVSTNQTFDITLDVSDLGDAGAGNVSAQASCTPAGILGVPIDPAPAAVGGHQTQRFTWKFTAATAGAVDCVLTASGADANNGKPLSVKGTASVQVQRQASLGIVSISVPPKVSRGQSFTASVVVGNSGDVTARGVVASPDPPQVNPVGGASATATASTSGQDIPGGGTATFSFLFTENGTGTGSLVLHAGAFGSDANSGAVTSAEAMDSSSILVQAPASLTVTQVTVPPAVDRGQGFPVTVEVTNFGEATATGVLPSQLSVAKTGGAAATTATVASTASIDGGAKATFTFNYTENGASSGTLVFSASASGLDANSGQPLFGSALPSAALPVQAPPLLVVSNLSVPATLSRGQQFTVSATVVNNGEATARCVTPVSPTPTVTAGGATFGALTSSPAAQATCPAGASGPDLAAGQSATFSWTATENDPASGNTLTLAVGAEGTDANKPATVICTTTTTTNSCTAGTSASSHVMAPAQLSLEVRSGATQITQGQNFTITVVVTNLGDATALNVKPAPSALSLDLVSGLPSAGLTSAVPTAVSIPGKGSASFVYDYVENGSSAGRMQFSATVGGKDANSGVSLPLIQGSSPIVQVVAPNQLAIESFAIPAALSRGQTFNLTIKVTNLSGGTLTNVVPSPNPPDQITTGVTTALPKATLTAPVNPVAPVSLLKGQSATFTYPFQETGTGTGTLAFQGNVSATDAFGGSISANPTSTATAVVVEPAALSIQSITAPTTVSRGQTFTATVVVANTGGATATSVLPDPPSVDALGTTADAAVTAPPPAQNIGPGASATFEFTMIEDGTGAGSFQLSTQARGSDANSSQPVVSAPATTTTTTSVQEPGHLTISQISVPSTISRGQSFTVSVDVTNDGGAAVQEIAPDASSPSVTVGGAAAMPVVKSTTPGSTTLDPGETTTFLWTYQDGSTSTGTLSFAATIAGKDVNSLAAVSASATAATTTVQNPAALSVTSVSIASAVGATSIDRGQAFTLTLVVANTGDATATKVLPSPTLPALLPTGGAAASSATTPAETSIAGGGQATFTFSYLENGTSAGVLQFSAGAVGLDANSGDPLTAPAATSNRLSVVGAPALAARTFTLPAALSQGQTFKASLVVENTGGSAAVSVLPDQPTPTLTGGAHATVTAPLPSAATIPAGASSTFTWTYVEDGTGPGTIALATSASGTDANKAAPITSGSISTATVPVQAPASLSVSSVTLLGLSGGPAIDRAQTATATVTVQNTGGTTAQAVAPVTPALTATGGANASVGALPAAQDIPAGQSATYTLTLTENGSGTGTLQIAFGANGTDVNSGLPVSATAVSSNQLQVQTPATLVGTMSAPATAVLGETFTVSFTVTNGGGGSIRSLSPTLAVDSAAASVVGGPTPAAILPGGAREIYTWLLQANASGTANLTVSVLATAVNTGAPLSANGTSPVVVGEAALVATDPFGDNSTFANIFAYRGSLYAGPNKAGTGGARMQPDGRAQEALTFSLNLDATGNTAPNKKAGLSFGADACKPDSPACGADNENARGFLGAVTAFGDDWLIGAGGLAAGGNFFRFYMTTDAMPAPDFSYVDTSISLSNGFKTATAAAVLGSRLYVGVLGVGGVRPGLVAITHGPDPLSPGFTGGLDPNVDPKAGPVELFNLQADTISPIARSAKVSSIDALVAFNDHLYAFNNGGCARSKNNQPVAASDWVDCTPSDTGYTVGHISQTTTKTADLVPSDKAFPAVVIWNDRLFAARNTTVGPQLWMCDPGADLACDPADWQLIAANTNTNLLDGKLSQFDVAGNKSISLLAATASHLYVGFDNANGVQLYAAAQTATPPLSESDFAGSGGCVAAQPGCTGIGGNGLGVAAKQFFDGKALTFPSGEQLFVAAGDGTGPVRLFRFAQ